MSLLDLHADDLTGAARNTAYIPPAPKPAEGPKFNGWKATTAPLRGARSGAQESVGFWADVIGAFGQVAGAYPEVLGVVDLTPEQRRQADEQRVKLLTEGIDYSSPAGDLFRDVARSSAPDPQTAHVAENLLYQFPRFATKAVGYGATTGPVVGSILTGADEAMAASDELKRQGVDLSTRTQAAAVQGVGAGLSVALPMAGNTVAQTVGLVAAGGPGTFVAQQALTREILRAADYSKIADQYDPLDPVGLAVATLVPAGFGAYGLRRYKTQAKADAAATAAAAEREFMAGPLPSERTPVAQAVDAYRPTPEQFDAALVAHQQEVRDAHAMTPREDFAGFARHEEALAKAEDQMARGEPVRVAEIVDTIGQAEREANFRAWFGDSKVVDEQGAPKVLYHGTASAFDEFAPEALQAEGIHLSADPGVASTYASSRAMDDGRGANVLPVFVKAERVKDVELISTDSIRQARAEGFDAVRNGDHIVVMDAAQVKSAVGNSGRFDRTSASLTDPLPAFTQRIAEAVTTAQREAKAMGMTQPKPTRAEVTPPAAAAADAQVRDNTAGAAARPPQQADAAAPKGDGIPAPEETAANTARLAEIQQQMPDLEVMLDGMERPQKLSDFLASVQREADEMRADAPDFEVAANCLLTNGG